MSRRNGGLLAAALALVVVAALLRCSAEQNTTGLPAGPVETVEISPANPSVAVGGTMQLIAIARDANGNALSGKALTWRSEDSTRVAVTPNGMLTGRTVGSTGVIATAEGKSARVVVTVSAQGTASTTLDLVLLSYLGGSGRDLMRDIATDPQGNVYVAGSTASPNFPVTANAFDNTFGANSNDYQDAFVGKFSPSGQVLWMSFLGGPGFDRIYALEVDAQGFVYVAGRAGPGLPVTPGAIQTNFVGGPDVGAYGPQDGFVCKIRPDGSAIVFCTYLGDSDNLPLRDIDIDAAGNIYVIGGAEAGNMPASWFVNGFQKQKAAGQDVIVAKMSGDGTRIIWATYVGGAGEDVHTGSLRVAPNGDVVVFFSTRSPDLPTPGGFDHTISGAGDAFVGRIANDGSRLIWGTYLGGSGSELSETHALAVDTNGDVITIAGSTSPDYPTTPGVVQPTFGGLASNRNGGSGTNYPGDMVVSRISADGSRLLASTYIGGSDGDGAEGVWLDPSGNIVVSGTTYSANFPVSGNVPQAGNGTRGDMALVKLSPDLTKLLFSVRLGGSLEDWGRATHVDRLGNVYLGGEIQSTDMPTLNPLQSTARGNFDASFAKFLPK
jgi:hypothetical protein